jgi:hypothetical protein
MRFVFLLFCMMAMPLSGFAQTPEQKAEQLFNEAEKYKKAGSYEKALERYTEAYVLTDAADLLFNIGQCQKNLKRFDEALKTYKKYLEEVAQTDESLVENFYALDLVRSALPSILESPDFPKGAFYKKLYKEVEALTLTLIKRAEKLPRPSLLTISGAEGSTVLLDGTKLTNLEETKVKAGTHKLTASKEGHLDFSKEFTATESGGRINVKVEHEAIGLTIAGPNGAEVALNGETKGQLPLSLSPLKAGVYKVRVMVPGHMVWEQEVTLPSKPNPMQLTVEASPIVVSFKGPEGAHLFVDGISQGNLPTSIEKLSRGMHKVEVKMDGFETFTQEITIADDKAAQEVEVTLAPIGVKGPDKQPTAEKSSGAYKALYGVAGAAAVGGGALAVNSIIARGQVADMLALNDAGLDDLIELRAKQADTMLGAAVGLVAVSAGAAAAGVVLSSKAKKETKATLIVSPKKVALVGTF